MQGFCKVVDYFVFGVVEVGCVVVVDGVDDFGVYVVGECEVFVCLLFVLCGLVLCCYQDCDFGQFCGKDCVVVQDFVELCGMVCYVGVVELGYYWCWWFVVFVGD